jgi:hypothetical protein
MRRAIADLIVHVRGILDRTDASLARLRWARAGRCDNRNAHHTFTPQQSNARLSRYRDPGDQRGESDTATNNRTRRSDPRQADLVGR